MASGVRVERCKHYCGVCVCMCAAALTMSWCAIAAVIKEYYVAYLRGAHVKALSPLMEAASVSATGAAPWSVLCWRH